jgi:hypothetical protein
MTSIATSEHEGEAGLRARDCRVVAVTAATISGRHEHVSSDELERVRSCVLTSRGVGTRLSLARSYVELLEPGELAEEVVRLLRASPAPDVVSEAFATLHDLGEAGKPALVRLARDADEDLRWHAFRSLAALVDADDVPLLIEGLRDGDFSVRWAAAQALGELGEAAREPLLRAIVVDPSSRPFHVAARQVLRRVLASEDPRAERLLASLDRPTTVYESGALAFELLHGEAPPHGPEAAGAGVRTS